MNVKELREFLAKFPDDMDVLYKFCSDYELLDADDIEVKGAVDQGGYWMRANATMSDDNKSRMKKYLILPGY